MSKFTDRLWREIVHEHGAELAELAAPESKHSRRARPRVLAGTSVALAGIGAAAVLLLSAAGGSPAYAVTRNHDGTVSVALRQLSAIPQLNAKLAALDVRAQVVPILSGCNASVVRMKLLRKGVRLDSNRVVHITRVAGARFDPRAIPRGKLLVIAAWKRGQRIYTAPPKTMAGIAAPACLPVPAPAVAARRRHCAPRRSPAPGARTAPAVGRDARQARASDRQGQADGQEPEAPGPRHRHALRPRGGAGAAPAAGQGARSAARSARPAGQRIAAGQGPGPARRPPAPKPGRRPATGTRCRQSSCPRARARRGAVLTPKPKPKPHGSRR